MSRIGKKTIEIPAGVTVEVRDGGKYGYKEVAVKGPKGEIAEPIRRGVTFKQEGAELNVIRDGDSKEQRAYHGLYRTLVQNMVDGVTTGYSKNLEIVGIGYRAEMQGTNLVVSVGYSHKITFVPPQGIVITVTDQVNINVAGYDKQMVGEVAAKIRAFRKPEPYKGKGIRYKGEVIKKKSTKAAAK